MNNSVFREYIFLTYKLSMIFNLSLVYFLFLICFSPIITADIALTPSVKDLN